MSSVDKQDLSTFEGYLSSFWMFLGMEQSMVLTQLERERNSSTISNFASDFSLRFIVIQKTSEKDVQVETEWLPDMLTTTNILIIKRGNFNIYK